MALYMGSLKPAPEGVEVTSTCEAESTCTGPQVLLRGDLLVCTEHAKGMSRIVSHDEETGVPTVRCRCGYYRSLGQSCGEPCL